MSDSQSVPNSQSVPDANSQPSTTPELQSALAENLSTSSHDPDVIMIDNDDSKDDKALKKGKSEAWLHFDKVKNEGAIKAVCKLLGPDMIVEGGGG